MSSYISSVATWFVPARGTWSRKFASESCSKTVLLMPCCASFSARHSPTRPAPTISTRSCDCVMTFCPLKGLRFLSRHDIFDRAHPAVMRKIEYDAVRVPVLALVERIRRCRPPGEIGRAGRLRLLLRFVEVIDP